MEEIILMMRKRIPTVHLSNIEFAIIRLGQESVSINTYIPVLHHIGYVHHVVECLS